MLRSFAAACLAFCLTATIADAQGSARPDIVLTGGKVFTADSTQPWAEAIAVRGERIEAVGSDRAILALAGPTTRRIALGGRVVVPGFNDAHDHVGAAEYGVPFITSADPTPDPSAAAVLDSLREHVRHAAPGAWLHASVGARALGDTTLRRAALDRIAPGHAVVLWGWTGHELILNSIAMRRLAVPTHVRDPMGGHYERDASGRLTGAMDDYAEWAVLRRLYSALPTATVVRALQQYAREGLRLGITSVQDMNGYLDPAMTDRALHRARLPIRLRVIPYPMTDASGLRGAEWVGVPAHPAPLSVVSGVKWILDGTPIERGALMRAPYADRSSWRGQLQFPIDTVRAILAHALTSGEPLHLHIAGDSTPRLVFALMRSLAPDSVWRPLRVRIEHGDWVSGELLPVARSLGVVIVENPMHFALDVGMLRARFGRIPAEIFPTRSVLAAGVPLAFGSDGPRNPFVNLMFAVTHPINRGEAITMEQAVRAYTAGSAFAEFAEHRKGTLTAGMLADLAVLSQDIFTIAPAALPATTSVLTMVGGRIVSGSAP